MSTIDRHHHTLNPSQTAVKPTNPVKYLKNKTQPTKLLKQMRVRERDMANSELRHLLATANKLIEY